VLGYLVARSGKNLRQPRGFFGLAFGAREARGETTFGWIPF